jgi:hypothetical protein
LNLEALLNELDGLRDGGGVAAPVALGLGEDRPPLPAIDSTVRPSAVIGTSATAVVDEEDHRAE